MGGTWCEESTMPTILVDNKQAEVSETLARVTGEWFEKCEQRVGSKVPLLIVNRRKIPEFRDAAGEVNITYPKVVDGRLALVIGLEDSDALNEVLLAHEVMHWVIRLDGFHDLYTPVSEYKDAATHLGSVTSHVPLHRYMRERGFDPQPLEDYRTSGTAERVEQGKIRPEDLPDLPLKGMALYLADLITGASAEPASRLRDAIASQGKCRSLVEKTLDVMGHYDLHTPDGHLRASQMVIKALELRGGQFTVQQTVPYLQQKLTFPR